MTPSNEQSITIKVKLKLHDSDSIPAIKHTMEQYRLACNYISEYIFSHDFLLNPLKINSAIYHDIRVLFGLKSMMAQSAIKTVVAKYKTVKEQYRRNPWHYYDESVKQHFQVNRDLYWLRKPLYFNRPQVDLVRNRDWSFRSDGSLSINTLSGRILATPICIGFDKYITSEWKLGGAKLVSNKGSWFLHISATKQIEEFQREEIQHIVGIDRGLRFIAVTYDENCKTGFISGKQLLRKRNKFIQLRKELQSKGTKSAKRALKRISGRENRWMSDVNHCLTKTLVEKYGESTLFVLEDLTGVTFEENNLKGTSRQRYEKRSWAFFQFEEFLKYKARLNNSYVLKVSPKYTSQRCPCCKAIHKEYRHHNIHEYICEDCGYRSNDDRVGAMNIQLLGEWYKDGIDKPKFRKITAAG